MPVVKSGVHLLDDRFFGRGAHQRRASVFEQAGSALPVRTTASKAFEFFGEYEPEIVPLTANIGGKNVETSTRGIFFKKMDKHSGEFTGDYVQVGTVKSRYQLVTPKAFCNLWDNNVQLPIVAMGSKGEVGETFYIASDIGELKVDGADIKCYIMGVSPMTGTGASTVRVTPINMWCTNQMQASASRALINARIPHNGQIFENTAIWMKHLKVKIQQAQELIAGDFKKMMNTNMTTEKLEMFMDSVYTLPEEPSKLGPIEIVERNTELFEREVKLVNTKRDAFQELFEGLMTGNEHYGVPTVFKAYNAAAELAQYWRGNAGENRAASALLGERGDAIELAYSAALSISDK